MEYTLNNIENYNYIINIFVLLIENKRKYWWWLKRHVGSEQGNYDPICSGLIASSFGDVGGGGQVEHATVCLSMIN